MAVWVVYGVNGTRDDVDLLVLDDTLGYRIDGPEVGNFGAGIASGDVNGEYV